MKKIFSFGLMAALACGISMSITSCKDDNNDSKSDEQRAEEQKAQATKALKFYDVVSHLADLSEMNDATYESQTFEPVVGEEDAGDSQTRIVATNDLETAAMRFADIVGLTVGSGFAASTPSYTYSDPDVGTLTWTRSTDGKAWATVDVDIKQVPHLTKIVYCSPEQMGENGSFDGTAYYRFGDVISREYTSKSGKKCTEYWICVRPAFGKEGKGDTHWISVGELPEDNMFHHSGSNGTEYYVPTKVCSDEENMQNFAEMMYAIFNPDTWRQNLSDYSSKGLKMFWDFEFKNIKYHNQYFWKEVYDGWKEKGIAEKAFNMTSMDELKKILDTEGLNLLYSGYSWLTTFSWYCELYNICYASGSELPQGEEGDGKEEHEGPQIRLPRDGPERDELQRFLRGQQAPLGGALCQGQAAHGARHVQQVRGHRGLRRRVELQQTIRPHGKAEQLRAEAVY